MSDESIEHNRIIDSYITRSDSPLDEIGDLGQKIRANVSLDPTKYLNNRSILSSYVISCLQLHARYARHKIARDIKPITKKDSSGERARPGELAEKLKRSDSIDDESNDQILKEIVETCINIIYDYSVSKLFDIKFVPPISPDNRLSWGEKFDSLLGSLPDGFDELVLELGNAAHGSRQALAKRLEPALNAKLQGMEQGTLDQKKAICNLVEKTLEPLGLAVKVPNTQGLPGKLKASTGHWPGKGRFHFEVYIDGKRQTPAYSDTLPVLELSDASISLNSKTPWQNQVGPKDSRQGRKITD